MNDNYWAIIKRCDLRENSEVTRLSKSKYLFGRSEECDIKFTSNKLLSSKHCFIERDETSEECKAWFTNTSTNGSWINSFKVSNKNKLQDRDAPLACEVYDSDSESLVEPKTKKSKIEEKEEEKEDEIDDSVIKKPEKAELKAKGEEDYADNLRCTICNEIMHDCISLQPCLHSYCAGCYSEWMEKSDECPICRLHVTRISKNHIINNLIDAYLKNNPDKKRSEEEILKLNQKNKITKDMLYPKNNGGRAAKYKDDYEDETDDENLENKNNQRNESPVGSLFASDEENPNDNDEILNQRPLIFNPYPIMHLGFANNQPHRFTCRQCPQNKWLYNGMRAPDFVCNPNQNHILCQCCLEAMPDRNAEIRNNPIIPKQACSMCFKAYCDLYWGCQNGGCKRCLSKFHEMKLNNESFNNLINGNKFESDLFSDWAVRNNKNIEQIFEECIDQLKNGNFKAGLLNTNETLNRVVCRECGIELFQELAYQYRVNIPNNQFFDHLNPRPNCYYGNKCRTQKHNYEHAKKFNHICEQTRID